MSEQKYLQMYRSKNDVNTSVFLFQLKIFLECSVPARQVVRKAAWPWGFLLGAMPFVLLPKASISQL